MLLRWGAEGRPTHLCMEEGCPLGCRGSLEARTRFCGELLASFLLAALWEEALVVPAAHRWTKFADLLALRALGSCCHGLGSRAIREVTGPMKRKAEAAGPDHGPVHEDDDFNVGSGKRGRLVHDYHKSQDAGCRALGLVLTASPGDRLMGWLLRDSWRRRRSALPEGEEEKELEEEAPAILEEPALPQGEEEQESLLVLVVLVVQV